MNRFENIHQVEGMPSAKFLRETAQLLLKYADAVDSGKVMACKQRYVSHVFSGKMKAGKFDEYSQMPNEMPELHECKHNIEKLAFLLAFAHCPITNEFFISPEVTKILKEQIEHFV